MTHGTWSVNHLDVKKCSTGSLSDGSDPHGGRSPLQRLALSPVAFLISLGISEP